MVKKSIKLSNQIRIISVLREEGPLSRKAISEKLNLTRASITNLSNELIAIGLIVEGNPVEAVQSRAGRKEILIDIKEDYWYLLGIDIEADTVSIGICTIKGKIISKINFEFDVLSHGEDALIKFQEKIATSVTHLLRDCKIEATQIFYCGIGMIGRDNYYQYRNIERPSILENRTKIMEDLANAFGFPITMENNVRALAVAEAQFFSTEKKESYLYIKFGPGLGSAIVFSNSLYRGAHGQAGEIGYSIVTGFYSQFLEDEAVMLEEIISLHFVKNELKNYWNEWQLPYLYDKVNGELDKITIQDIYQALVYKEILIEGFYKKKMKILAQRIYDYKNLLDLERVYLFFSSSASTILYDYLIQELAKLSKDLANETKLSQITTSTAFLGGSAIAYVEGIKGIKEI